MSLLVFGKILPDRVHCARVLGTRIPSYYRSRKSACVARTKCLIDTVVWKVLGGRWRPGCQSAQEFLGHIKRFWLGN